MKKIQGNNNIYYYEVSSKANVYITGITVSMCEIITLEPSLLLMTYWIFKISLERDLDLDKYHSLWD